MEDENPTLLAMGMIIGTVVLFMASIMENPFLIAVALIIYGMGFGGAIWNKMGVRNRKKARRDQLEIKDEARRLRREFRGTPLKEIKPVAGFGDGIYEE